MSKLSHRKGGAFETEIQKAFEKAGIKCVKTGTFQRDDLVLTIDGIKHIVECKRRKRGFAQLYAHIANAWAVAHRDDRQESLITLRLADLLNLMGK